MYKFFKTVNYRHIFWFCFYFFIFCLLLRNSFNYLDPDFGWHLKVGQEMMQTGSVAHANNFNYILTGDWVDHEWLSNFLTFFIYQKFGYIVLSVCFSLLVVFTLIILNIFVEMRFPKSSFLLISLIQTLGLVAALPHLGVRIQELALLFLLLLLIVLYLYTKYRRPLILVSLPLLICLWACLHASFLIALFLLGSWFLLKIIEKCLLRFWPHACWDLSGVLSSRELLTSGAAIGLSLAATLLTPYRLGLYSFLNGYNNTVYQSYIHEWLSQFSFPFFYLQLLYLALVTLALILYLYYAFRHKYFKINLWNLFLVSLFIVLSFKSRRHFPLMFIASFIFLIEVYGALLGVTVRRSLNSWLKTLLFFCLLLVSLSQLLGAKVTNSPFLSFCDDYPCAAVEFLKSQPSSYSQHLLNNYAWGGYLIWVDPQRSLFIDGRLPQVELAGHTYLEEYLDFYKKDSDIGAKLKNYQITLVLIPNKDKELKAQNWEKIVFGIKDEELQARNYLREYLESAPDWQIVFRDNTSVVYAKK